MTKEQWGKIIGVVLTAVIALLAVFGYDVIVDQPREQQIEQTAGGGSFGTLGVGYNTACYMEQGGAQFTADNGCTIKLDPSSAFVAEGSTADDYETTIAVTDPTADRTVTLPNASGTVMLTNTPGAIVLGTNTVTTTLAISHGLTTPQTAFCTLLNDSEANGATCSMTISGGTVTLKLWKADGVTAGSVGKLVSWMIGGQP